MSRPRVLRGRQLPLRDGAELQRLQRAAGLQQARVLRGRGLRGEPLQHCSTAAGVLYPLRRLATSARPSCVWRRASVTRRGRARPRTRCASCRATPTASTATSRPRSASRAARRTATAPETTTAPTTTASPRTRALIGISRNFTVPQRGPLVRPSPCRKRLQALSQLRIY